MIRILSILLSLAATFFAGIATAQQPFQYRMLYAAPGADRVNIEIQVPDMSPGSQVFVIPRAIPMGYTQEPYDRFVLNVAAFTAGGVELAVVRGGGSRWIIGDDSTTVSRIRYEVDIAAMEQEIFDSADASKRRQGYLSLLGYSVFAYLEGYKERQIYLSIAVPDDWPVTSTLAPVVPARIGQVTAKADSFYALADSQIMAGPDAAVYRLDAAVPLYLALYTEGEVNVALLSDMVEESMAAVIEYFGSAPFPHFTVVQELLRPVSPRHNYNYSMEHLQSATFYLSDDRGITSQTEPAEIERTRFNYAHHFAHAWIPKRLSGKGYRPFNWELAPVLDTIWFSEGFAQYLAMAALADQLAEADRAAYLDNLIQGRFRDNLDGAPMFSKKMSLTELSHSASTLSSQDFRTLRHVSSRGGMIAAEMDALIREQSGGTRTLRDGLRYLMRWSEQEHRPLDMEELPGLLQHAVGVDTRSILQDWKKPMIN